MFRSLIYKIRDKLENRVVVLMYHRIANIDSDPWNLAVSPENFEQHLKILKSEFNVIPVQQMLDQLEKGRIKKDSICLTFDDAYLDNYLFAKPILEKYKCPATFFIPSHYIDRLTRFWWDELEDVLFNSIKLPLSLSLCINQEVFFFKFKKDTLSNEELQKQNLWAYYEEPPTERCELYLELWKRLKQLELSELMSSLKQIKDWAGYTESKNNNNIAMTLLQLRDLIKNPLFKAGIHTRTHPALASHTQGVQKSEILSCRQYLIKNLETYINVIAYPSGNYNETTIDVLKEINVAAALTTNHKVITKHSNLYRLGRFHVNNMIGEKFKQKIIEWHQSR